jgi:hypothetical protein
MTYVIEFYRNDRRMGTKPWPEDLATAKVYAINYMSIHQATHVAVIDDTTRQIIFTYPEGRMPKGVSGRHAPSGELTARRGSILLN